MPHNLCGFNLRIRLAAAVLLTLISSAAANPEMSFRGLGDFEGGIFFSRAHGVSNNGIVVGHGDAPWGREAFRWTDDTGLVGLGDLPGGDFLSTAFAISADGRTIAGSSGNAEPVAWFDGGPVTQLGVSPGRAWGVSGDGSTIVGYGRSSNGLYNAFRWTSKSGVVGLGFLPGGGYSSASGASFDGSVVVGTSRSTDFSGGVAYRWTKETGMTALTDTEGWSTASEALAVSDDGSVATGVAYLDGLRRAFRWTESEGMTNLGTLEGGAWSDAAAISADGRVIVGYADSARGHREEAFVWTERTGMVPLFDILEHGGVDMTGWSMIRIEAISPDGTFLAGSAQGFGGTQAFLAVIPAPSAIPFLAFALALRRNRR